MNEKEIAQERIDNHNEGVSYSAQEIWKNAFSHHASMMVLDETSQPNMQLLVFNMRTQ